MKAKQVIKHIAKVTAGDIVIVGDTGERKRFTFDELEAAAEMGAPFAEKSVGLIYVDGSDLVITVYERDK